MRLTTSASQSGLSWSVELNWEELYLAQTGGVFDFVHSAEQAGWGRGGRGLQDPAEVGGEEGRVACQGGYRALLLLFGG